MPSSVKVEVESAGFSTVARILGEIDIRTQDEFAEAVLSEARVADRLVLDMTDVSFIDSLGIGALVRIRRTLQERGQATHIVPSRRVLAALELATVTTLVKTYDDLAAALLPGDTAPA